MNGVLGMAELLSHTPLTEKQRRYVDQIRGSGDDLLHIINDILDFSKIEAGKITLERKPFSLAVVVNEIVESCRDRAQALLQDRRGDSAQCRGRCLSIPLGFG